MDFVRRAYGDNEFFGINCYYELQWYPLDYRNQLTLKGGSITKSQGFQPYPCLRFRSGAATIVDRPPRIVEDGIPGKDPADRDLSWLTNEVR